MAQNDKNFSEGLYFSESDQQFIHMKIGLNKKQLIAWMKKEIGNPNEWINIDVKKAKNGKLYGEINTYNPKDKLGSQDRKNIDDIEAIFNDKTDIPF